MAEKQEANKFSTAVRRQKKVGGHGFAKRCHTLVKEQRARLYILRRCATMLLCWYIHGDE